MLNLSNENRFDLHENEPVSLTHFDINGFALRLVWSQRQTTAQKCPFQFFFVNTQLKITVTNIMGDKLLLILAPTIVSVVVTHGIEK